MSPSDQRLLTHELGFKVGLTEERLERRERVRELWEQGMTLEQICEAEGISHPYIREDLRSLGLIPLAQTKAEEQRDIAERRDRVRELWDQGYTTAWIAEVEGRHHLTIKRDLLELERQRRIFYGHRRYWRGTTIEHVRRTRELQQQGVGHLEIARELGINPRWVRSILGNIEKTFPLDD